MLQKPNKQSFRFTPETLQTIIQKNLTLYQYFDHLYPLLKSQKNPSEQLRQTNFTYSKDYLAASILKMVSQDTHFDQLTSILGSSALLNQQSYEYGDVEEALNSMEFISKLHPYINSLLTTTNIGIVKETLKVHMLMETNIQKSRALHRIKSIINILTLHQLQKNVTSIICDLEGLNKIFSKVGFILSKEQYQFYYNQLWDDLPEVSLSQDYPDGSSSSEKKAKNLQIYDLIAVAAQLQETQVLKTKLRQWMNNEEFFKYYNKNHSQKKKNYNEPNSINDLQTQSEQLMEENLGIVKLRIQHLNPMELLHEIEKRGYNISVHYKQFTQFRKGLLEFHDKETQKRKKIQMISSVSHKNINVNLTVHQNKPSSHGKGKKSNFSSTSSKQFSNAGQQRRDIQHKLQQQAFNLKMLNGVFIRDQIAQDIAEGKANYLQNCNQDGSNDDASFINQNSNPKLSCLSINTKTNDDLCKEDIRETLKSNKTSKLKTHRKLIQNNCKVVQKGSNKQRKIGNKQNLKKMGTSINIQMSIFSSTSTPSVSPKKQNKHIQNSGDYYALILGKVKGQPFFNLGAKILNG